MSAHEWIMLGTFRIDPEYVESLVQARMSVATSLDEEPKKVPLELGQERLETLDGPGCKNCGVEWSVGWGGPCPGKVPLSGLHVV